MEKKIILTPEGKKKIEEELVYLKSVKRPEIAEKIGIAREFGDLSENAEYDTAKNEQGMLESKISELESTLLNCVILDQADIDTSKVSLGCTVKVYDEEFDEEVEYKILGSNESDPKNGIISNESPVGKALLGKKKGELVTINTGHGNCVLKILEIKA